MGEEEEELSVRSSEVYTSITRFSTVTKTVPFLRPFSFPSPDTPGCIHPSTRM